MRVLITGILLCFCMCVNAQKSYDKEWLDIDTLIVSKNLTRTALSKVDVIYANAKAERNYIQVIKALMYRQALSDKINDKVAKINISTLKNELQTINDAGAKAVINFLIANNYRDYYNSHRYNLYNRSKTKNFKKEDIETWNIDDFHNAIQAAYEAALQYPKVLQRIQSNNFLALIIKGNTGNVRPTLYDLVAQDALEYYKSDDYYLTKPSYAFVLNNVNALAEAPAFVTAVFESKDSASLTLKAIKLYQDLLKFHLNDDSANVLIAVDIDRIIWIKNKLQSDFKNNLYYNTLSSIIKKYPNNIETQQAYYLLASMHNEKAASYKPLADTANRYEYNKALSIINEQLFKKMPEHFSLVQMQNLKDNILAKEISVETEKINLPDEPFRSLLTWRNTDTVYIRIINYRINKNKITNNYNNDTWKNLASLPFIRSSIQITPNTNDHQKHSAEIKVDGLPLGEYIILLSSGKNFSAENDKLARQNISISNISYIQNDDDYFVLHRSTGKPLSNAKVKISYSNYNSKLKRNEQKIINKTVDANGKFRMVDKDVYSFDFTFINNNDTLNAGYEYNYYRNYNNQEEDKYDGDKIEDYEEDNAKIFYFLDRSIYRPGQTVYFKGIGITKDYNSKKTKLFIPRKDDNDFDVFLYDVNNKIIDSVTIKLNEYGSFNGRFKIPVNVLTGRFKLGVDYMDDDIYFNVEEYKRPKFYVKIEKPKGTYRLGDSVTVKGYAKAYAGNNIDAAEVKYNIQRTASFPYAWRWWGFPQPSSSSMQIADSSIKTNADGSFEITFKAIADDAVNKNFDPFFNYNIDVEVTDLNGETRTAENNISVSYKALQLEVTTPSIEEAKSLKNIFIYTKNAAGEAEPAVVNVKIYEVKAPQVLKRNRLWAEPDMFILSEAEYAKYFPNDVYKQQNTEQQNWPVIKVVLNKILNTKDSNKIAVADIDFAEGWYKVEAITTDKYGQEVKQVKFIQLYNTNTAELATPAYNWMKILLNSIDAGETAKALIGTSAKDVYVIQQTKFYRNGKQQIKYNYYNLSNSKKLITYQAMDADRGGLSINYAFVKNNRAYSNNINIYVPYNNKQLGIEVASYRNKTEPGSNETWSVKLTGYKGEAATAEVLASMYDASLDQYKPHEWSVPDIWEQNNISANWDFNSQFLKATSNENWLNNYKYINTSYDHLAKYASQLWNYNYDYRVNYAYAYKSGFIKGEWKYDSVIISDKGLKEGGFDFTVNPQAAILEGKVAGLYIANDRLAQSLDDVVVTGYGTAKKSMSMASSSSVIIRGNSSLVGMEKALVIIDGVPTEVEINKLDPATLESVSVLKDAEATALYGSRAANGAIIITTKTGAKKQQEEPVKVRTNFNETAFFFPNLYANEKGEYAFSFTIPEALTQWKWQTFAHTKDLSFGLISRNIVTQKTLMVQPNAPRFLRQGDKIDFSVKLSSLALQELSGQAVLQLFDAETGASVDGSFMNTFAQQYFTVGANASTVVKFSFTVPYNFNSALTWRVTAKTNTTASVFSDGEENTLPVLSNRILITESLPLRMKGSGTKTFTFNKLINNKSETLQHQSLTVEYTPAPVWLAVQALPYLINYPYECAEQTFNKFFANALAAHILQAHPKINNTLKLWLSDSTAFKSKLQDNEHLKQLLLEETPWVLDANNDVQQQKNLAVLMDVARMSTQLQSTIDKLDQMQLSSGGFAWFKGGNENYYITQYIALGIGKLLSIDAIPSAQQNKLKAMAVKAVTYLQQQNKQELMQSKFDWSKNQLYFNRIQYLYTVSLLKPYGAQEDETFNLYYNNAKKFWNTQTTYMQAMIGYVMYTKNEKRLVNVNILPSIKENILKTEDKGYSWKDMRSGYYRYEAPVEHQAMMINFLQLVNKDFKQNELADIIIEAKNWLLSNKQTQSWSTTIATADAVYALVSGDDAITETPNISIKLGTEIVKNDTKARAPSGYIKQIFKADEVSENMGNVKVDITSNKNENKPLLSWGAVYWQYFEDMDKVTAAATPLSLTKKLFVEKPGAIGPVLQPLNDGDILKVGDKVKVQVILKADRDMEYIHLKDMRASSMEPVNILSGYKWQDGIGYYESTKDASTNFFIDQLRKGTYVFEYPVYITHTGSYTVGIASIQCMYAPEFNSHSEGIKIKVGE